jgi:endonuclease/exonuclease/phosphatase (EEP) superfamily protein YafD
MFIQAGRTLSYPIDGTAQEKNSPRPPLSIDCERLASLQRNNLYTWNVPHLILYETSLMASSLIRTILSLLTLACILSFSPLVRAAPRQQESDTRLPRLVVTDIKTDNRHGRTVLSLTISQETQTPRTLEVPILIRTGAGDIRFDRTLTSSRN